MTNPYYNATGSPLTLTRAASATIRSEFTAIQLAFDTLTRQFGGAVNPVLVSGTDGGIVNAYTVTPETAITAYVAKMVVLFTPVVTNTGASTLSVGYAALPIVQVHGAATVPGDLVAGVPYLAEYNGTSMQLLSTTKNYIDQLSFNSALPAQPGGTVRRYLSTYSGAASWVGIMVPRTQRTANTIITAADAGSIIEITANSFTQTFDTPANLGAGFSCQVHNNGTGDITVNNLDGLASYQMFPGEHRNITTDGVTLRSDVLKPYYRKSLVNYNRIQPPGYSAVDIDMVGGAGGAGSGCKGVAGGIRNGGAAGGSPSRMQRRLIIAPGTAFTVSIGAAGVSGVAQTVNSTSGNPGANGGNTTFGTLATAFGGVGGVGGGNAVYIFTTGSGSVGIGLSQTGSAATGVRGGYPGIYPMVGFGSGTFNTDASGEGGASAMAGAQGGNSIYGGASTGSTSNSLNGAQIQPSGSSLYGVGAASQGGWITDTDTLPATAPPAGKAGGWNLTGAMGGTCGASPTAGGNGAANAGTDFDMGNPGAGGGSTLTAGVSAGAGGNGSFPGGPPGGGGACLNGAGNSGAGGIGQPGQCIERGVL